MRPTKSEGITDIEYISYQEWQKLHSSHRNSTNLQPFFPVFCHCHIYACIGLILYYLASSKNEIFPYKNALQGFKHKPSQNWKIFNILQHFILSSHIEYFDYNLIYIHEQLCHFLVLFVSFLIACEIIDEQTDMEKLLLNEVIKGLSFNYYLVIIIHTFHFLISASWQKTFNY